MTATGPAQSRGKSRSSRPRTSVTRTSPQLLDPPGEPEIVDEQGAGVSGAEEEPPAGPGDILDTFTGLQEPRSRVGRVYAAAPGVSS